ncbi:carboxypeptidase-like regulatory domain-containing protein [Flavobacterium sp. J49]|uniref:carboxypeptidase-like regulatory domain-containing protein n=1 Tax=Flavobacterium sp. J49 TaxID=2718534 RepID=UPI0015933DDD|nr:carboxypeptidase-like regulatory domain-containing protein [Flavobacterium sp. J49]MBF6641456.1 carboxypeptidase-like regulatory domain-containing protein [Flavobacterium sp. J49]NIC02703.1 carboxypeptidase-like regulatory domain-containing protein [Flavobacterium sp. J49]
MKSFLFLFLFSISLSAQTTRGIAERNEVKGVVKDSLSGQPIPYVNIWVENENIATTSEEDGTFSINVASDKNLIFSALGYEKKTIKASQATAVFLSSKAFDLDEVIISNSIGTKQMVIGQTENTVAQAFDNGPRIDVKYFPYNSAYQKTKYIKKIMLNTDSRIEDATVKIRFYRVDANGFPGEEMLKKDLIVSVKYGTRHNKIDLSDYNLVMPKAGLFVGFEKLMIEKNKKEKTVTDQNTKTIQIQKIYYPFILYNYVEREALFTFSGGKWQKQAMESNGIKGKVKGYEPAINLVLTN